MNSVTHGLGLVLTIAGLSAIVTLADNLGTARCAVGCGVYGASLVLLYAASTLFHSWPAGEGEGVSNMHRPQVRSSGAYGLRGRCQKNPSL